MRGAPPIPSPPPLRRRAACPPLAALTAPSVRARRRWSFDDVNRTFPTVLSEICAANSGVQRLVHVSSIDASFDSPSSWARSKMAGEEAVREAFPSATILRPSTMFGDEDRFLNRIAKLTQLLPVYPLVEAETTRQQPVYCNDVAAAVMAAVQTPSLAGKTLDLAGPNVYTNREIVDFVFKQIVEPSNAYSVPRSLGFGIAAGMNLLPNPWMTLDGVRRQTVDIVKPEGTPGFEACGIVPTPMEEIADRYLVRFRKTSVFVENEAVIKQPD